MVALVKRPETDLCLKGVPFKVALPGLTDVGPYTGFYGSITTTLDGSGASHLTTLDYGQLSSTTGAPVANLIRE